MGPAAGAKRQIEFPINRESKVPLYQQLVDAVGKALRDGAFLPGDPLPAIQELAQQLQVSRNTVKRAYEKLAGDGSLQGTAQSGFWVRNRAQERTPERSVLTISPTLDFDRTTALEQINSARFEAGALPRPFRPGCADITEFPIQIWETLRAQALRRNAAGLLGRGETFGNPRLREAIANRLRGARGLRCTPEQVVITAGGHQALHLTVQTLVSPGDTVAIEEPGYYGAKAVFLHAGARVVPILVDEEGLTVPNARPQNRPVMLYTTPPSQFPTGAKLSLGRRAALLQFARETKTWIIEDDSDGEFSYSNQPLASLQGADDHGRVIYLGTTGKTLFPSLEIAYLIVPRSLIDSFSKTQEMIAAQPSAIDQATLASFICKGHFDEHVRRTNALYYRRLQTLLESAGSELDEFIQVQPAEAGLHAVGWLKRGVEERMVADCAARAHVELPLLSNYGRTALTRPGVLFGFAPFTEKRIRRSAKNLGRALRSPHKRPRLLHRLLRRA